jgi:hypothetical protein
VQVYTKDLIEMMSDIQLTVSQMFEDMKKTTHHDGNGHHKHHRQNRMVKLLCTLDMVETFLE